MDVAGDGDVVGQGDGDEHGAAAAQRAEDLDVGVGGGGVDGEAGELEQLGRLVRLVVGADDPEHVAGVAAVGGPVGVDLGDTVGGDRGDRGQAGGPVQARRCERLGVGQVAADDGAVAVPGPLGEGHRVDAGDDL